MKKIARPLNDDEEEEDDDLLVALILKILKCLFLFSVVVGVGVIDVVAVD